MNRPLSYDECNCFALRQASRFVTQLYERHLAEVGVTAAQFTILAKLARRPNLTMVELADAMVMDRTTLVRALKPLQRDGFIASDSAEHDTRTYVFSLTESGERVFDEAAAAWRAAQEEFEAKFGKSRAKLLRKELFSLTEAE
ncbi:MarR family winged helix-turn-helix transcriptional regulator [Paraburkholderia phosphatilytica]|uniref:MarR family winged helix-turn-helix transcriptional regulator n=1 Tax=Paraburkholderia phosphatilytica TaxID=2282883 RepID=UPI000E4A9759|nr:MarR family transcriptional regulator [Paraburkholderia phosphatilytica]